VNTNTFIDLREFRGQKFRGRTWYFGIGFMGGWPATHPQQSVRKPLRLRIDYHTIAMTTLP
jgi:hypothetical protein